MIRIEGLDVDLGGFMLQDINLEIDEGEYFIILGPTGAGKTVLMSLLYGLYSLDEGEILIDGEVVEVDSPSTAMCLGIGMVHQHFMLVPSLTVAENIILGMEQSRTASSSILRGC